MRDPYNGKYNTDLTDYRAKVLAECDDPNCDHNQPERAAHDHSDYNRGCTRCDLDRRRAETGSDQ
jgi:hypothetical protein